MRFARCTAEQCAEIETFYRDIAAALMADENFPQWSASYPASQVKPAVAAGEQYAVWKDGQMVGAVMLGTGSAADGYEAGNWLRQLAPEEYLVVHALAVSPEARGAGVGEFLVKACLNAARQRGFQAVRLDIVPENLPAEKLYVRCGFRPAGTVPIDRGLAQVPRWKLLEYNF